MELLGLFFQKYWRQVLVAGLIVSNIVSCDSYLSERREYKLFRDGVGAYAKAQEDHNAELRAKSAQITQETTDGWKAALDYLRAHPVSVLPRAGSGAMPGISGPANGAYDTSQNTVSAATRIATDCAETTLELNKLQDWVARQKEVK